VSPRGLFLCTCVLFLQGHRSFGIMTIVRPQLTLIVSLKVFPPQQPHRKRGLQHSNFRGRSHGLHGTSDGAAPAHIFFLVVF
jgi:hypothetical protein